jgi:predicted nucleic acid-binding protein
MNPLIVTEHAALQTVLGLLGLYRKTYKHVFLPDDLGVTEALASFPGISGHRQTTDAYLVSLASSHGGRLVTFDSGIEAITPAELRDKLLLVKF